MNPGSGPDRDDSGLPPVDIEIPDDASELDRDVQAYHRELRAQRRRTRIGQLHGPLTRDGLVLPLLAGFLAMVLISGVLLTVLTAGQSGAPHQPSSPPVTNASIGSAPGTGDTATGLPTPIPPPRLPNAAVVVHGQPLLLSSLASTVLALVPAGCQCSTAVRQLRRRAATAGVTLYLVNAGRDVTRVRRLATRGGPPAAKVADDPRQVLAARYHPHGLTAVLVRGDGSVALVVRHLQPTRRLNRQIRALAQAIS